MRLLGKDPSEHSKTSPVLWFPGESTCSIPAVLLIALLLSTKVLLVVGVFAVYICKKQKA
jgi:hypothetical protein